MQRRWFYQLSLVRRWLREREAYFNVFCQIQELLKQTKLTLLKDLLTLQAVSKYLPNKWLVAIEYLRCTTFLCSCIFLSCYNVKFVSFLVELWSIKLFLTSMNLSEFSLNGRAQYHEILNLSELENTYLFSKHFLKYLTFVWILNS